MPGFSTVISTVVEILGEKPKAAQATSRPARSGPATVAHLASPHAWFVDTLRGPRLVLKVPPRTFSRARSHSTAGEHEGETHIPAQQASPQEDARVPGSHGDQERPHRSQAPADQGPQAADGRRRAVGIFVLMEPA